MGYRILADEHIDRTTIEYLQHHGHDVKWIGDIDALGLGATDHEIATYAKQHDRLILTRDNDFFLQLDIEQTAGILFQTDHTLSARDVGAIIHELSQYIDQSTIVLEYLNRSWL